MKKVSLLLMLTLGLAVAVNAQEFKKFRLAAGLGYAKPGGKGSSGGFMYAFEPGYRVMDALAVSLRVEGAIVARGISTSSTTYQASVGAIGSYTVNGIYYLSNEKFRPYVGAGVGLYKLASVSVSSSNAGASAESKIGFYPRIGFDFGHFNVNLDYNIVGASTVESVDFVTGNTTTYDVKNGYFSIRIGGYFLEEGNNKLSDTNKKAIVD